MANKAVKDIKKKGRHLRRTIRKTLGTLFLVSALVVAAIPVDYLQAVDGEVSGSEESSPKRPNTDRKEMKVSIRYKDDPENLGTDDWYNTKIPDVTEASFQFGGSKTNIYTSEDLVFDFAVSNIRGDGRFAVIVGYHNQNQLNNVGETLTIPRTLDAYAPYGSKEGTLNDSFSCAIGGTQGELLFYRTVDKYEYDPDGNIVNTVYKYYPCLFQDKETWAKLEWNKDPDSNICLYYLSGLTKYMQGEDTGEYKWEEGIPTQINKNGILTDLTEDDWKPAKSTMTERFKDIQVSYIANQYVDLNNKDVIKNVTQESGGIFSTATVSTLKVEPNLIGIGKYAFSGTHIQTVELSDSVVEIGNHAFEKCDNLTSFKIGENALNVVIGDHAFSNCKALREFDARNVQKVGDSAFEACDNLQSVNLLGTGTSGAISKIGYYAFSYCINLEEMVFPSTYTENNLLVSTFEGCSRLKRIYGTGETISMNVAENDGYYSFEKFKSSVDTSFYFEGAKGSILEQTVIPKYFVYKYSGEEVYEKKVPDEDNKSSAIFEVTRMNPEETGNGSGKITNVEEIKGETLNIPARVGPLSVVEIAENGLKDNRDLKNVIIPATINTIGASAFEGCHNLKNVVFDDPTKLTSVGARAFKTQEGNSASTARPELNFISRLPYNNTHSIENEAFLYAMEAANNIEYGSQPTDTYIKYFTGWPSNLVVQYDKATDKNTLIEYPTFTGLLQGSVSKKPDGSYVIEGNKYNDNAYFYMTDDYQKAALNAAKKYLGLWTDADKISDNDGSGFSNIETEVKEATLNIDIPAGVEAIATDLFKKAEEEERTTVINKNVDEDHLPNKKLTTWGLSSISDNAFERAEYLTSVSISGETTSIGSYAFKDCNNLMGVSITPTVSQMGTAPFIGCNKLQSASFNGSPYFTCSDSIIYELNEDGTKKALVEYLNGRGSSDVRSTEAEGITAIYPEAFKDTDVRTVDLSSAKFKTLSKGAFQNTLGKLAPPGLQSVVLPATCDVIEIDAFTDSTIRDLTIPNMKCILNDQMFGDADKDGKYTIPSQQLTVYSPDDSLSQQYAENYCKEWKEYTGTFTVNFWGYDAETGEEDGFLIESIENVEFGNSVVAPTDKVPVWEDHEFLGWDSDAYLHVTSNLDIYAKYSGEYSVIFYDSDWKTVLFETSVLPGKTVNPPAENNAEPPVAIPSWRNKSTGEVMSAREIRALPINQPVEFIAEYSGTSPSGSPNPDDPNSSASPGPGGQTPTPGPGGQTPGPGQTPTPGPGGNVPQPDGTFELTVHGGSGSGFYAPGSQIIITADAAPEGQKFVGWDISPAATVVTDKTLSVTILTMPSSDVAALAKFESKSGSDEEDDGKLYSLQVLNGSGSGTYPAGTQVIITANTAPENQEFTGWDISPAESVVVDKTKVSTIITMPASDAAAVANFAPKDGASSSPSPAPSSLHSLIVHNGSGSGSFATGAQIVITANDPAPGQEFTGWTVSPDSTVITDKTLPGAVITMPDNDVAVIANYKSNGTGSGNTSSNNNSGNNNNNNNSGSNNNSNTNRPSTGGTTSTTPPRGGTTVVIDKNGLSNTGVVSATVNGSSDNFTIKITESREATEAIVKALMAEYGSVDNIKYFPMDISLYDSTGNTKITDTTGLSVSITLPLPDSLINYAGNNKVAGVVNDRLDKLTPRFTTINGVSCVTFTAEHFSPYVIYVDVTNLSDGTVTDTTPTTGDGIHPKWFLSIGLACLSFVMFMIKDGGKTPAKKRKVKVRA